MARIKKFYFKLNLNMLLFFLGIIAGTVAINCFYGYYGNTSSELISTYFGDVGAYSSYGAVFLGIFIRRVLLAVFVIAVFKLFNNIWIVYVLLSSLGIFSGIVMTVLSMNIGVKSIWAFILMCFPHVIVYALSIYIFTRLKFSGYYAMRLKESYVNSSINSINKRKGYFIATVIFVIGVLAETFNALYILPRVSELFI